MGSRYEDETINNQQQNVSASHLCVWRSQRHLHEGDQVHPRFAGWVITAVGDTEKQPTILAYLPPIEAPINEYGTIFRYFINQNN